MTGDAIKTTLLSAQIIANADPMLLKALEAPAWARSLGIFTTDCDDVSYVALDEATKKAAVEVVYARSMYAGAKNASTANAGEFIGILPHGISGILSCFIRRGGFHSGQAFFLIRTKGKSGRNPRYKGTISRRT